jgi:hypothetical protein
LSSVFLNSYGLEFWAVLNPDVFQSVLKVPLLYPNNISYEPWEGAHLVAWNSPDSPDVCGGETCAGGRELLKKIVRFI